MPWELLDDDDAWAHPLARQTFPAGLRDGVLFVHAHRERLYRISESLPRTLCHLDFWPKNLFCRPRGQVVVIDWGFAGSGAIGEDAGNLVPDAVFDHFMTADQMRRGHERHGTAGRIPPHKSPSAAPESCPGQNAPTAAA